MDKSETKHTNGYGVYILVWMSLLVLTSLTVSVAGMNFEQYTLLIALTIAAIKSYLVITIFMHIKFDDPIFKLFILVSILTLFVIFVLTFVDYSFR
jgi:cytochrome c oxidase subunit 4